MHLRINLTRGNLRGYIFLVKRTRKIMTPLSYLSSNLSLIAFETMRLLVIILRVTREKQTLRTREISMLALYWYHFSRFALGLCFMMSKKEDNTVKLRQYLEIFCNRIVQE